jgi:hypothetical protein
MITIEQVSVSEQRAKDAEKERSAAADALQESPYSELAAVTLAEKAKVAAQLGASARELREEYDRQVVAERASADRGVLEKAAETQIATAARELEAARLALAKRAETAQKALVDLMDQALAYNRLVASHAEVFAEQGLTFRPGEQKQTAGGQNVEGDFVAIKGRHYALADAGGVAVWVLHRVGAARLPDLHPVAGALQFFPGCQCIEAQADSLFDGLSRPKKLDYGPTGWFSSLNLRAS